MSTGISIRTRPSTIFGPRVYVYNNIDTVLSVLQS